jgi:predicted permease
MSDFLRDIRYGVRLLVKNPGFTAVALLTLAIGIGATTAMFSVVNAVLLRPLPFKDPNRLVLVKERLPKLVPKPVTIRAFDVDKYARENTSFDAVAGYIPNNFDLTGNGVPQKITGFRAGGKLFSLLGVEPLLGRTFTAEDDHPDSYLAVVSYRFWKQQLGGSSSAIGKTITLDRKPYEVIGVMPAGFQFPLRTETPPDIWVPMGFTPEELQPGASSFAYGALARLKPGVTMARAQADVGRIGNEIEQSLAAGRRGDLQVSGVVVPLKDDEIGDMRKPLLVLFLAVLLVLLIAVVNVANLLLARGTTRQRELAIRIALGAGARRLVAQLLVESVILGVIGGALGMALAVLATSVLANAIPPNLIRLDKVGVDGYVLLFTFAVSIAGGLAFGAAPAIFALHTNVNEKLKEGGRGTSVGRQHQRVRSSFVVAQVALALMLLAGAGLLLRSFQRVLEVDPGFQPDHVITAALSLSPTQYATDAEVNSFYTQLRDKLEHIPGVKAAALSNDLPMETQREGALTVDGYEAPPGGGMILTAFSFVAGDYFKTMGIPLVRGRLFTDSDNNENSENLVIISQSIAQKYFAGRDPIGGRLKLGTRGGTVPWATVVGVVGNVKSFGLDEEALPHIYKLFLQRTTSELHGEGAQNLTMAVRTMGDPKAAGAEMRSAVWSIDRQVPVTDMRTMEQVMSESNAPRRFNMILVAFFAFAALLLAAVGLYGVMSYSVSQRAHEIGVRMTLGARRADVLRMVLRSGITLVLIGVAIGVAGALAASRLLTSFLFEVKPSDPVTFFAVAMMLAAVALVASMAPALRATKVDPMIALRNE